MLALICLDEQVMREPLWLYLNQRGVGVQLLGSNGYRKRPRHRVNTHSVFKCALPIKLGAFLDGDRRASDGVDCLDRRISVLSAYTALIRRKWRPKCPSVMKLHDTACSGSGPCRVVSKIVAAKRAVSCCGITRYPNRSEGNNTLLKLPAKITNPLGSNSCKAGMGGPE